jgi:hypothetical protein
MRTRLFAVASLALLGFASFVSAQAPVPVPAPAPITAAPRPLMSQSPYLQMEMVPQPMSMPHAGFPGDPGAWGGGAGGCGCGPTVANSTSRRTSLLGGLRIGCGCAIAPGCNNIHTEKTFIFGSCRQFFNAGSDCGPRAHCFGNCTGGGLGCCVGIRPYDPCSKGGNSFLNR